MRASAAVVAGTSLAMGIACLAMLGGMVLIGDSTVLDEGQPVSPTRSARAARACAIESGRPEVLPEEVAEPPSPPAVVPHVEPAIPSPPVVRRPATRAMAVVRRHDVLERALARLPPTVQHCLRAARVRVVLCDGPPTSHPFNADVRDLPRYRGRHAFFRRFGNIAFIDSSRGREQLDRSMLIVLAEAFDSWAGDVSSRPELGAAIVQALGVETPVAPQVRRDQFATWFAIRFRDGRGMPEEPLHPAAAAYFRGLERELELFESWMVRTGAAFATTPRTPTARSRTSYAARLRWLVATDRPRVQAPRPVPTVR